MKLLSVIVPCYNSQDYMRHCIDSLLPGGDDVEIIIINDGSGDRTAKIAETYQRTYPGTLLSGLIIATPPEEVEVKQF